MNTEANVFDVAVFDTIESIDEAIVALRAHRKSLKSAETAEAREVAKAEKQALLDEAKANIVSLDLIEGDEIRATLKGEEVVGNFVKVTDARFVILVDGEKKTLPFDKFLGVVAEQHEVAV